jgi:sulfur-oxidizing protein SoxZ
MTTKPRFRLPSPVKAGDVIEVKTLITHVMETGQRKDGSGKVVPRHIINLFTARFNGAEVFKAELQPGISADPYLAFHMRVPGPGVLEMAWTDDDGVRVVETVTMPVS